LKGGDGEELIGSDDGDEVFDDFLIVLGIIKKITVAITWAIWVSAGFTDMIRELGEEG
jgi:hypothetical protein